MDADPTTPTPTATPASALALHGALATLAVVFALRWGEVPASGEDPSTPLREALQARAPDVVLLGNSMLRFGVDALLVDELLAEAGVDLRVAVHAVDATFTPYWYLVLKNVVLATRARPALVGLLFADPMLTSMRLSMDEANVERLRHVARTVEPELWRAWLQQSEGTSHRVRLELRALFPLYRVRAALRTGLLEAARALPGALLGGAWPRWEEARAAVMPLRVDDPDAPDAPPPIGRDPAEHDVLYDFERDIDRSLLPSFLALARAGGFDLALLRFRRGPWAEVTTAPSGEARRRYARALDAWADEHGALRLDFVTDPLLTPERYTGPDHLDDAGRVLFSARVAQVLARWDALRRDPLLDDGQRAAVLREALAAWTGQGDPTPFATVVHEVEIPAAAITHVRGHLYRATLPLGDDAEQTRWLARGDDVEAPRRSPWALLEDGRPLGPSHSAHHAIVASGAGRFSHWEDEVLFSSSDGTSPITNGRTYVLRFERPVLER